MVDLEAVLPVLPEAEKGNSDHLGPDEMLETSREERLSFGGGVADAVVTVSRVASTALDQLGKLLELAGRALRNRRVGGGRYLSVSGGVRKSTYRPSSLPLWASNAGKSITSFSRLRTRGSRAVVKGSSKAMKLLPSKAHLSSLMDTPKAIMSAAAGKVTHISSGLTMRRRSSTQDLHADV
eukprot:CAMPEP_0202915124 /NCGR_PEP_ID=MMETSP1392-20130828/64873_1 /ASSEMBLY_ACC=CAM_ASM_000868 /TAXON_ID=225041 /ORGANISM="Chlamydomonas chlamydogama, Strain SAG 11-48b" /LENGTH=180 /DNA_ID=CAMNT_0049607025 /DNA_START=129 /DNA_END=674 /DNA_ORIENTATION=+